MPPGALGKGVLDGIITKVRPLVLSALSLQGGDRRTLDVDIDPGDRRVTGTVGDIFGNSLGRGVLLQPRREAPAGRVAQRGGARRGRPDENWTAHTIGKHRSGGRSR
ncbi:hypothetical protein [Nocardioides sp. B-3]|uniref:hypothetical protein n=1 Tax=Nocardioides sp. B-3 TaxID=2895565 RepID=UPI00300DFDDB